MNITRFEPWTILDLMQHDRDRFARRRNDTSGSRPDGETHADWAPAVDIIEQKDRFVLRADLPGVSASDIDVNMDDGVLSLTGQRSTDEHQDESEEVRRRERMSGKFYRRFNLPDTANTEKVSARSANGILEIRIPKLPQIESRRITVEAA